MNEETKAYSDAVVAQAPPLTEEQIWKLRILLARRG